MKCDLKMEIISEIASSHDGDIKNLRLLVKKLSKTNIDYIKFQIFNINELAHKSSDSFKAMKDIEFKIEKWKEVFFLTKKLKKKLLLKFLTKKLKKKYIN